MRGPLKVVPTDKSAQAALFANGQPMSEAFRLQIIWKVSISRCANARHRSRFSETTFASAPMSRPCSKQEKRCPESTAILKLLAKGAPCQFMG